MELQTYFGTLPFSSMSESPLLNRLKLVKNRCKAYPMDSLDFIMIDLERPSAFLRHAHFCAGDLTGRYLEMLAASIPHDKNDEDRMHELFWRILKCQSAMGPIGEIFGRDSSSREILSSADGVANKLFAGLLRYYTLTENVKALDAAVAIARYVFDNVNPEHCGCGPGWLTEPLSILHAITGDTRCVDYCRRNAAFLAGIKSINGLHSHGLMSTLRGLQLASIYTGDISFNEQPERFRAMIQKSAVWLDGNIPESFPASERNEGCSLADWIRLNLLAGFISGADEAYDKAELCMLNAFSMNQLVNGGFGHQAVCGGGRSYGFYEQECWWCCLESGGMALTDYANHAVVLKENELKVNLFVPGVYEFNGGRGGRITVRVSASYPEKADSIILVEGAPANVKVSIRASRHVRNQKIQLSHSPHGGRRYILSGDMGYSFEESENGLTLKYGPLVMAPLDYRPPAGNVVHAVFGDGIPAGYATKAMPNGIPSVVLSQPKNDAGFLVFDKNETPAAQWQKYEEGARSRIAYGKLSVNVPLKFPDGSVESLHFFPELNSTTAWINYGLVPIVFAGPHNSGGHDS